MRPIDADELIERIKKHKSYYLANPIRTVMDDATIQVLDSCIVHVAHSKTIEADSLKHGKWEYWGRDNEYCKYYRCSVCHYEVPDYSEDSDTKYNFCPNCGADMRVAEGENNA